ncbi:MAG: signal peptide peptidase SppA [Rhodopirellula sp.]|nr:signal peptide peptidase SppA [Rhodopirellula sp.]
MSTDGSNSSSSQPQIIVNVPPQNGGFFRAWFSRLLLSFLLLSVFLNFALMSSTANLDTGTQEKFVSGDEAATDRIVIIEASGTIMPPFTERIIEMVEDARDDDNVKGVVLVVDSPGGLVADSHQIYHRLKQLSAKKPVYVAMKRIAASGGVYIAMGAGEDGKIFAEPTTWTGSIGVIIPRYDLSAMAEKFGVKSDSLTTGPFKDSLNMFKPLSEDDRELWGAIMDDSFDRFVKIVAEGRKGLDEETVRTKLATGQVFTANQALKNGLIDEIAFDDEVVDKLQEDLGLTKVRVVKYTFTPTVLDILLGNAEARAPEFFWQKAMESTVPRAMYYCSWLPSL